jgi:hypothetical protein
LNFDSRRNQVTIECKSLRFERSRVIPFWAEDSSHPLQPRLFPDSVSLEAAANEAKKQ